MAYIVLDLASDTEETLSSGESCSKCNSPLQSKTEAHNIGTSQFCTDCYKQEAAKYLDHVLPTLETIY